LHAESEPAFGDGAEAGFQTRLRFTYVRKQALEDFLPAYAFERWADPFPHTVVEILYQGKWRSFDPSFDARLYQICLDKKINFARYRKSSGPTRPLFHRKA
jgi:hypothetical protein